MSKYKIGYIYKKLYFNTEIVFVVLRKSRVQTMNTYLVKMLVENDMFNRFDIHEVYEMQLKELHEE